VDEGRRLGRFARAAVKSGRLLWYDVTWCSHFRDGRLAVNRCRARRRASGRRRARARVGVEQERAIVAVTDMTGRNIAGEWSARPCEAERSTLGRERSAQEIVGITLRPRL